MGVFEALRALTMGVYGQQEVLRIYGASRGFGAIWE